MVTEHYNMIYEYTRDIMGLCKNIHEILAYKVFCRYSIDIPGIPNFDSEDVFYFFGHVANVGDWSCRGFVVFWGLTRLNVRRLRHDICKMLFHAIAGAVVEHRLHV